MALAEVNVHGSAANAAKRSPLYELMAQYNDLAERFEALLQKLDGDAGVASDYESTVGESKKILLNGTAPTPS